MESTQPAIDANNTATATHTQENEPPRSDANVEQVPGRDPNSKPVTVSQLVSLHFKSLHLAILFMAQYYSCNYSCNYSD